MSKRIVMTSVALASAFFLVVVTVVVTLAVSGTNQVPAADGRGIMPMSGDESLGSMHQWMGRSRPNSEAAYLSEMVAHHEEAVTAATELTRSERPQMRDLGAAIVESQTAQITQMNDWLIRWYPDAAPARYEPMMRDLSGLETDELDRAFLDDMIGHHMMAVMMSQHLLVAGVAEHDEVTALAQQIRDEQRSEIATMMAWHRDWYGSTWRGEHMGPMGMTSG